MKRTMTITQSQAREVLARIDAAGGNVSAAAHQVRLEQQAIRPYGSRVLRNALHYLEQIELHSERPGVPEKLIGQLRAIAAPPDYKRADMAAAQVEAALQNDPDADLGAPPCRAELHARATPCPNPASGPDGACDECRAEINAGTATDDLGSWVPADGCSLD